GKVPYCGKGPLCAWQSLSGGGCGETHPFCGAALFEAMLFCGSRMGIDCTRCARGRREHRGEKHKKQNRRWRRSKRTQMNADEKRSGHGFGGLGRSCFYLRSSATSAESLWFFICAICVAICGSAVWSD